MAKFGTQGTKDKTAVGNINGNTKGSRGAIGSTTDKTAVGNLPKAASIAGVRSDGNKGRGSHAPKAMPSPTRKGK